MREKDHLIQRLYLLLLLFSVMACRQPVAEQTEDPKLQESLPDPLEAGWEGRKVCEVLEENEKLRVLKCTFPPGFGHEKHYQNPHVGYTLVGGKFRITDESGTREVEVPTGYIFSNEEVIIHEVFNIGETTSQYLIIEYK